MWDAENPNVSVHIPSNVITNRSPHVDVRLKLQSSEDKLLDTPALISRCAWRRLKRRLSVFLDNTIAHTFLWDYDKQQGAMLLLKLKSSQVAQQVRALLNFVDNNHVLPSWELDDPEVTSRTVNFIVTLAISQLARAIGCQHMHNSLSETCPMTRRAD